MISLLRLKCLPFLSFTQDKIFKMISLPSKPKIVEKNGNRALFEISSLYPGYGVTMGNSMRRVLLSSLYGAAVTKVKIDGVKHEFSVLTGVLEDVMVILQNLKNLRFRVFSEEPQKVVLDVKGEKEVKGSDLKAPSQLEIVTPDVHIATITNPKTSLSMEMEVSTGVGYSPLEDRKEDKLEIGQMLIDAIFTPVRKVNFRVENMRVGKRTDFDRLFLDIETDGTVTPEDAFSEAANILMKHFSLFAEKEEEIVLEDEKKSPKNKKENKKKDKKEDKKENKKDTDPEDLSLDDLKISTRTKNILEEGKVRSVKGILKKGEKGILEIKGMGKKGMEEIKKELKKKGISIS